MTNGQATVSQSSGAKVKELFRKYGKVAIGVHIVVYATFLTGCYVAVDSKVDVRGALSKVGLLSPTSYDETADAKPEDRGWMDKMLSGGSSTFALAFICNKALFPVRTPITVALTPMVASLFDFGMFNFGPPAAGNQAPMAERKAAFAFSLTALNEQFRAWVTSQDKAEVWTDGVEDYLTYAKQLLSEYHDVVAADSTAPPAAAPAAPALFNFSAAPATGAFSGGFGFGTAANGGGAAADDDEDDEEEEEEEEADLQLDSSTADILHTQRVSLLSMDHAIKKWKNRGMGTVSVRRSKAPPHSPYLVFTTDAGRILINAPLPKGMKPVVNPKMPKNLIMVLISVIDGQEDRGMQMFKCESADARDELKTVVESVWV